VADLDTALHALPRILSACRARGIRIPRGAKISSRQAEILGYLDQEDPAMVGELADHAGVTASTMSLTLTRMEEGGWIRRERDPVDRRVMNVRLTEAGGRLKEAVSLLDPERVHDMLHMMRPPDRGLALRGLALLAEAADALVRRGRHDIAARIGEGSHP
jgi:DNA-binding MarR family transcriptional regulator